MNFSIIIPAHNEADCIGLTLDSLLNQTRKPFQIIVVDDHSTDNTPEILKKYSADNELITVIRREEGANHLPGSKVVQTFNAGLPYLRSETEIICKYDADLVFPKDYLEKIEVEFSSNEKIGMCGGYCLIEKNGEWIIESLTAKDHLRGALKAYRKTCFEAIGGLRVAMGWDTADELLARYHGWEVKTIDELGVKHLRPTGAGYNLNARYLQGSVFYRLRYGFCLSLLASVKLAGKKGKTSLFVDYLKGYFKAKSQKQPFLVDENQGKWIRNYRWKAIREKFF